jgi:hypothetical protein
MSTIRAAAVSTHLDDVALSCFSVLRPGTAVVTVLAGIPPEGVLGNWDEEGGATNSRDRVIERRAEDHRALSPTGSDVIHLDFAEGQQWGRGGIVQPSQEELSEGLREYLEPADAVYVPAGIWNSEHKLVRDAALAIRPEAILYADLPYALVRGFEVPIDAPQQIRARREERLDGRTAHTKVMACQCYATQLRQLTTIFGNFLNPDDLALEVFWDWRGGWKPPE